MRVMNHDLQFLIQKISRTVNENWRDLTNISKSVYYI